MSRVATIGEVDLMAVEQVIRDALRDCMHLAGKKPPEQLTHETVLLECGLDSLDFAMLVARLEEILEFDPFTITSEVVYPRTFGEFVAIYSKHADKVRQT